MKKYLKELIIIIIQLIVFYLIPIIAKFAEMGMVLIIIILTFLLSIIIGVISRTKIKYFYPIIVSIIFIPTVFIYYNESALIHSVWYLMVSAIGLFLGATRNKKMKRIF